MGILLTTLLWDLLYMGIFGIVFLSFVFITKRIYKNRGKRNNV